jgi:pilus assembly protein CpaB
MDTKRIALIGGMVVLGGFMFLQMKKLGTPPPAPKAAAVAEAPVIQQIEMAHVLVANQTLYLGTRLTPEMLEWRKWPKDAVGVDFIEQDASPTAIEDYTSAAVRIEVAAGEPLTARKIVKTGDRSVMSAILSPGMRAVSVRITSDTAASGFINPGDQVDIVMTRRLRNTGGTNNDAYSSRTVFRDVKVLSIDQNYSVGPEGNANVMGSQALFELSPSDAETLTMAQAAGDISLILRPLSAPDARGVRSAALMENTGEERVQTMTVNRGGVVETVMLKGN